MSRFKADLVRGYYRLVSDVNRLQQYLEFHPQDTHARDEVKALKHAEAAAWARVLAA